MESERCLCDQIADVKRQLSNPKISGPRKRDLTKYLWRLMREYGRLSGGADQER